MLKSLVCLFLFVWSLNSHANVACHATSDRNDEDSSTETSLKEIFREQLDQENLKSSIFTKKYEVAYGDYLIQFNIFKNVEYTQEGKGRKATTLERVSYSISRLSIEDTINKVKSDSGNFYSIKQNSSKLILDQEDKYLKIICGYYPEIKSPKVILPSILFQRH